MDGNGKHFERSSNAKLVCDIGLQWSTMRGFVLTYTEPQPILRRTRGLQLVVKGGLFLGNNSCQHCNVNERCNGMQRTKMGGNSMNHLFG